jgi:hypothetical protein
VDREKEALGKLRALGRPLWVRALALGPCRPLPDLSGMITNGVIYLTPGETRKAIRAYLRTIGGAGMAMLARLAEFPYQSYSNFMEVHDTSTGKS